MSLSSTRLSKRASLLHLSALKLAQSMRSGNFKSLYRGQGIEFQDVRDYLPGDNVRLIDWNVTARMGRAFIKQYNEDRELSVLIILDCSPSMYLPIQNKSKLSCAIETAAMLLLACKQNDGAIGAVFFDGKIQFSCPPKSGRENSMMLLSKFDTLDSNSHASVTEGSERENGSALTTALKGAAKILKKRSLVFVISDFRTTGWEEHMARLSQKNDVVSIRITDSYDKKLPKMGTTAFFDTETHKKRIFPTLSKDFAQKWEEAERKRSQTWKDSCTKHGAYPLMLSTEDDCVHILSQFFDSTKG